MMDSASLTCENKSATPRWWNTERPLTHSLDCGKEQAVTQRTCSIDGCDTTKIAARGWCKKHYRRWQNHGDPNWQPPQTPTTCTIDGCEKPHLARGWCSAHWERWNRHGDPLAGGPSRQPMPDRCTADEACTNPPHARGMCATHWRRNMAEADPEWHENYRARRREWHASDPERIAEYRRRHRARHPEKVRARVALWRAENRDQVLLNNWLRRRREYGLPENVVETVHPDIVFDRDKGFCQLCLLEVDPDLAWPDPASATIDHKVPVIDPASEHSYANTWLAHWDCNRRKSATQEDTP